MKRTRIGVPPEWEVSSKKAEKDGDSRLHYMKNLERAKEFPWPDTPIKDRGEVLHTLARRLLLKEARVA